MINKHSLEFDSHLVGALKGLLSPSFAIVANGNSPQISSILNSFDLDRVVLAGRKCSVLEKHLNEKNSPPPLEIVEDVIASSSGEVEYFHSNIASESGLIEPSELSLLWKNIKATESEVLESVGLEKLWEQYQTPPDWLFVESLDAVNLLKHAPMVMSGVRLIMARVASKKKLPEHLKHLSDQELAGLMSDNNMIELASFPTRHIDVTRKLYCADLNGLAAILTDQLAARTNEIASEQDRIRAMVSENNSLRDKVDSLMSELNGSTAQNKALLSQCAALQETATKAEKLTQIAQEAQRELGQKAKDAERESIQRCKTIEQLRATVAAEQNSLSEVIEEQKTLQDQLELIKNENVRLQNEQNEQAELLTSSKSESLQLSQKVNSLQEELESAVSERDRIAAEMEELRSVSSSRGDTISKLRESLTAEQNSRSEIIEEQKTLQDQLELIKNENARLQNEQNEQSELLTSSKSESLQLSQKVNSLQEELESAVAERDRIAAEMEELRSVSSSRGDTISKLRESLTAEQDARSKDALNFQRQSDLDKRIAQDAINQRQLADNNLADLQTKYKARMKEVHELDDRLKTIQSELQSALLEMGKTSVQA